MQAMRDKQIWTRVSQETYDWVSAQAEAAGVSRGAAVAAALDSLVRCGATLEYAPRIVRPRESEER